MQREAITHEIVLETGDHPDGAVGNVIVIARRNHACAWCQLYHCWSLVLQRRCEICQRKSGLTKSKTDPLAMRTHGIVGDGIGGLEASQAIERSKLSAQ